MFARSNYVWLLCFMLIMRTFSDGKPQNSSVQPVKKSKADQNFVVNNNCGLERGDREMMKYIKDKVDYIAERSTDQRGSACPDGWVRHGNSCFLIIDTPTLEWEDARRNCQRLGGDLAKITSSAENQFIFGLLIKQKKVTQFGVWLGIHRKADNKFYWADDTPLTGYKAWFPGEPNNLNRSEKCGHMWGTGSRKGRWNDYTCTANISRHAAKDAPVILCQRKANH